MLDTLRELVQANLANARLLARMQCIALLLQLARRIPPPARALALALAEAVGLYHFSPEDTDIALALATPPSTPTVDGAAAGAASTASDGALPRTRCL